MVIHVPFPKRHLTNHLKNIYSCYGFLESRQEPIKRILLNTWILIVVFNEILIPQDFFSMTTVTRQIIRHRRFMTTFQNQILLKLSHLIYILLYAWKSRRKWHTWTMHKIKWQKLNIKMIRTEIGIGTKTHSFQFFLFCYFL